MDRDSNNDSGALGHFFFKVVQLVPIDVSPIRGDSIRDASVDRSLNVLGKRCHPRRTKNENVIVSDNRFLA